MRLQRSVQPQAWPHEKRRNAPGTRSCARSTRKHARKVARGSSATFANMCLRRGTPSARIWNLSTTATKPRCADITYLRKQSTRRSLSTSLSRGGPQTSALNPKPQTSETRENQACSASGTVDDSYVIRRDRADGAGGKQSGQAQEHRP